MLPLSDSLVAAILSVSADAIICVDREQRITFFNEGAESIFGYESKEMLGQPLATLLPERYRSSHGALMESFGRSQRSSRRMGDRSLISGVRKNGEEFIAEAAIAHMPSEAGSVFSVVLRDVTEQRRAQEMNERLLVEMERAVKQRDEMLALVSHDLRNPANAVKMLAGAILRATDSNGTGLSPDVAEHAAVMLQAASQMDALIQDLLDSTRLEAGRLRVSPQWSRPSDLVSPAVETLTPLALAKSITLSMRVPCRAARGVRGPRPREPGALEPHRQLAEVHARRRHGDDRGQRPTGNSCSSPCATAVSGFRRQTCRSCSTVSGSPSA